MCGNNAHGNIEEARKRGGCGYEGHWKTYLPLVQRKIKNVEEKNRSYSSKSGGHDKSKLDASPGWRAGKDKPGEWMMMDLGTEQIIAGVQLQGRDCNTPNKGDWWRFKEFSVSVSLNGTSFSRVEGSGGGKFFAGPPDSWTKTDRMFPGGPVAARFVKLTVHSWHHHIAGRAAIILAEKGVAVGAGVSKGGESKNGGGLRRRERTRRQERLSAPARGAMEYALKRREVMRKARARRKIMGRK